MVSLSFSFSLSLGVSQVAQVGSIHKLVEDDLECTVDNSEMADITQNSMPAKPVSHILTLVFIFGNGQNINFFQ